MGTRRRQITVSTDRKLDLLFIKGIHPENSSLRRHLEETFHREYPPETLNLGQLLDEVVRCLDFHPHWRVHYPPPTMRAEWPTGTTARRAKRNLSSAQGGGVYGGRRLLIHCYRI
jgi:hypothetical protein